MGRPRGLVACGHGNAVAVDTEAGRCWDCHVAHLRDIGQGDRADRLVAIRRQHDEGRFDPDALLDGLAERLKVEFAKGAGPDEAPARPALRLRRGEGTTL